MPKVSRNKTLVCSSADDKVSWLPAKSRVHFDGHSFCNVLTEKCSFYRLLFYLNFAMFSVFIKCVEIWFMVGDVLWKWLKIVNFLSDERDLDMSTYIQLVLKSLIKFVLKINNIEIISLTDSMLRNWVLNVQTTAGAWKASRAFKVPWKAHSCHFFWVITEIAENKRRQMVCIMLLVVHPHSVHGKCGKALDVGLAKFWKIIFPFPFS